MHYSNNTTLSRLLNEVASHKLPAIDMSLGRVTALLDEFGNPQLKLPPVVHIAGTNGKGSTLAFLQSVLRKAGYRVHKYTSPHLVSFNERIQLNSQNISDDQLIEILNSILKKMNDHSVTFFEATTVAAFLAFAQTKADIVLLETGMGGRLDATNVIPKPHLTAITPISLDHKEFLGNTITRIASEKAGIIKSGVPCVIGKQTAEASAVFSRTAKNCKARLFEHGKAWRIVQRGGISWYQSDSHEIPLSGLSLPGHHQIENAATAVACLEALSGFEVGEDDIAYGLSHAHWSARLQKLKSGDLVKKLPDSVELWLDGGHNPDAGIAISEWAEQQGVPLFAICGMLANKESMEFLEPLAPYIKSLVAVPIPGEPNARPPHQLANLACCAGIESFVADSADAAIEKIIKRASTVRKPYRILICGSLYLAGHILKKNS
jgi:dihydrofolate synthase/folylpolyglutamate synthase